MFFRLFLFEKRYKVMWEWLAKYWLEVIFGLILGGFAWGGRQLVHFYVKEMKNMLKETEERILTQREAKSLERDKKIEEIRMGLLSVQGQAFKEKCHRLLSQEHQIDVEELENITKDHDAYKGLGGNHEGDMLFALVLEKAKNDIAQ